MKVRNIVLIVIAAVVLLAGIHFALNTDWMTVIRNLHTRPQH